MSPLAAVLRVDAVVSNVIVCTKSSAFGWICRIMSCSLSTIPDHLFLPGTLPFAGERLLYDSPASSAHFKSLQSFIYALEP